MSDPDNLMRVVYGLMLLLLILGWNFSNSEEGGISRGGNSKRVYLLLLVNLE